MRLMLVPFQGFPALLPVFGGFANKWLKLLDRRSVATDLRNLQAAFHADVLASGGGIVVPELYTFRAVQIYGHNRASLNDVLPENETWKVRLESGVQRGAVKTTIPAAQQASR
jgi:hypothetical protein